MMQTDHMTPGAHSTDLFCDAAVSYIENVTADKPFFLNVAFMAPHDPRSMPQKFLDMFDPQTIPLPANFKDEHDFDYGIRDVRDEILTSYPRTEVEVRRHLAEYYAMIAHLDAGIGRILESLADKGLRDNTIVVFAGDNGLALGQHGLFGKQSAYEHSIRVPLILTGPGIPENERRDGNCYLFDLYPTLMDLLRLETPVSVEGRSLKEAIVGDADETGRKYMYFAYEDKLRAVKAEGYKLIEYSGEGFRRTQLFDLVADPLEKEDLAGRMLEKVSELRKEMVCLRDEWDDMSHPTGESFWGFCEEFR